LADISLGTKLSLATLYRASSGSQLAYARTVWCGIEVH
jgi:hypothetical protein